MNHSISERVMIVQTKPTRTPIGPTSRVVLGGLLLALTWTLHFPAVTRAQNDKPQLQLRRSPTAKAEYIRLRPLARSADPKYDQKYYLYVTNPSEDEQKLIVKLQAQGMPEASFETTVPGKNAVPVKFGAAKDAKP